MDVSEMIPLIDEAAIEGLKFSECLPLNFALDMLRARLQDPAAVRHALRRRPRMVSLH